MSKLRWEVAKQKTRNRIIGTIPAFEYEGHEDDYVCGVYAHPRDQAFRGKSIRLESLLKHEKSEKFKQKPVHEQMEVVQELHSIHVTLFFEDAGYYSTSTHRLARRLLHSYKHWLKKNSIGHVFIP
jgi:hypothetical protein